MDETTDTAAAMPVAMWDAGAAGQQDYRAQMQEVFERDRAEQARLAKIHRKRDIGQLARDLLLTVVRRGDQQIDPAAIYDVARRFVEAGEAE